jgi:hypothetical protein
MRGETRKLKETALIMVLGLLLANMLTSFNVQPSKPVKTMNVESENQSVSVESSFIPESKGKDVASLLMPIIPIHAKTEEERVIFSDDFESYSLGSFPSRGGWRILEPSFPWKRLGTASVTNEYSYSGTKSLKLQCPAGIDYLIYVAKNFDSRARYIGYEVKVLIRRADRSGGHAYTEFISSTRKWIYGEVIFDHRDLTIKPYIYQGKNEDLRKWQPGVWYKIRVILDRESEGPPYLFDTWVNDIYAGKGMMGGDLYSIDEFCLEASPGLEFPCEVYFDDVKVFSIEEYRTEFQFETLTIEDKIITIPIWFKEQRLVALPAGETKKLKVRAQLKSGDEVLNGKRVKLLIDNTPVSENTTQETFDVAAYVSLTYGLHEGRLVFDGDDKYPSCSAKFTILAYKSSGFQVEKDGYSFENWGMTLTDFLEFVNSDYELRALGPFAPLIYPLLSLGGHCFGMAYTSSLYYTGGLAKPRADATTYSLTQSEADDNIRRHHIAQVPFLLGIYPSESVAGLKRLLDEGIPPVIAYDKHAITGIGYAEVGDDFYLIAYDNNLRHWYKIYRVDLNAGRIGEYDPISDLDQSNPTFHEIRLVIRPVPIMSELISGLMKSLSRNIGIIIHSNVDIKITSTDGGVMQIVGGETLRNDFGESQVYLSDEAKIFLLPANAAYDVELACRENGIVSITCSVPKGDSLVGTQFNDVTVSTSSKITFTVKPGAKTGSIGIDNNGDGKADSNISPDKTYSWSEKGIKEVLLEIFGLELGFIDIIMMIGVASLAILVATIASIFLRRRRQRFPPPPPATIICPYCGAKNYANANFCRKCGMPLDSTKKRMLNVR